MTNNIKKFNIFVNENDHKDIDPFGEEDWEGKMDLNMENFVIEHVNVETVFHVNVNFAGNDLEYEIHCDEDNLFDFEMKDIGNIDNNAMDWLENHYEEVKELLKRECR